MEGIRVIVDSVNRAQRRPDGPLLPSAGCNVYHGWCSTEGFIDQNKEFLFTSSMPAIPAFTEEKKCITTIGPSVCHPSWCPVISYKPHVDARVVSWHLVTVFSLFEDAVCRCNHTCVLSIWITLALFVSPLLCFSSCLYLLLCRLWWIFPFLRISS